MGVETYKTAEARYLYMSDISARPNTVYRASSNNGEVGNREEA